MVDLNIITNENNKKWSYLPDHPYRILIIEGSKSERINSLINLINEQNDIDKIYLNAKDLSEPWYKYLIKKLKNVGINYFNDLNARIECSNTLDDVYENINDYNPSRKAKILIVFDDRIADVKSSKTFLLKIEELFIRFKRLNVALVFIIQSYFTVPKDIRLNFV